MQGSRIFALLAGALAMSPVQARPATEPVRAGSGADWITDADYPKEALAAELEGSTTVVMHVDDLGHVAACRIDESSGHEVLDRAACDLLTSRGHFEPARNRRGRAIAQDVAQRVVWRLPSNRDRLVAREEKLFSFELPIGAEDQVETCSASTGAEGFCQDGGRNERSAYIVALLRKAGVVGQFRVRTAIAVAFDQAKSNEQLAPASGWASLALDRALIQLDDTGNTTSCVTTDSRGPDRLRQDLCSAPHLPKIAPATDASGKPVGSVIYLAAAIFVDGPATMKVGLLSPDGTSARAATSPATWVTDDDYPKEALDNDWQGTVSAEWTIDTSGKSVDCKVTESSGYVVLDQASCRLVEERARYIPATDGKGHAIVAHDHRRFVWHLPLEGAI